MDMRDNLDKLKNFRLLLMRTGMSNPDVQNILQGVVEVLIDIVQPTLEGRGEYTLINTGDGPPRPAEPGEVWSGDRFFKTPSKE